MGRAGRVLPAAATAAVLLLSACTAGGPDVAGTGTSGMPASSGAPDSAGTAGSASRTATRTSIAPVTPDGLLTGPGVDDTVITLGLVVDPAADRGFASGVRLWQTKTNGTTGVCGRTVQFATASGAGPADYEDVVRRTLGLISLPAPDQDADLATRITKDQVPAITPIGRSADLSPSGPMVIGATDDILAINGAAYLVGAKVIAPGDTLGVITDGSAASIDAEIGLRWYAQRASITLDVRDAAGASTAWSGARAVMVLGGPSLTNSVLQATPADLIVLTSLTGYDPATFQPSWTGRLLLATPTTALDSDHPGAEAVVKAFTDSGKTNPGPLLFAGFAAGTTWGRLLEQACSAGALTRTGIRAAAEGLGPASPDSLVGATDLSVLVGQGLPATRSSAIAKADPSAPGGLSALTWLAAAPGIGDYVPGS